MAHSGRRLGIVAACAAAAILCTSWWAAAQDAPGALRVVPDHENGVYKSGEKVRFVVTGAEDEASYEVQLNGAKKIDSGKVQLKKGTGTIACGLKEPGWLMVTVTSGGATAKAGAAVDPFEITPSLPAPDDFDKFWDAQKKKLAEVPMNARLTPVEEERKVAYGPPVECFDVQLDCLGDKPASGYYCRPKGAKPKSLPAFLSLHSAGVRGSSQQAAWMRAKQNMLGLDLNAHGLPNGKPAEFYNGLRDGELRGYAGKGIDSPETFYFLGMYLRIVRAIDFLTSQPEWDGKTVIVGGSSQGGGQSLVAAGIDPRVTELQASVPAFCDQTGFVLDRKPGWPGTRVANEKQQKTLQYFDACNFAARTKAKATVVVGLVDTTCPAIGVLAAYNQLKGDKSIIILPLRGHGGTREDAAMEKDAKFKHAHPRSR